MLTPHILTELAERFNENTTNPPFSSILWIDEKGAFGAISYAQSFAPLLNQGAKDKPCDAKTQTSLHRNSYERNFLLTMRNPG